MEESRQNAVAQAEFSFVFQDSAIRNVYMGVSQSRGQREYQEDSVGYDYLKGEKPVFAAIVADGMGGLEGSGQVSAYTVEKMLSLIREIDENLPVSSELSKIMGCINEGVQKRQMEGGSTAAAVYFNQEGVFWCCVGDSRVYLFRKGVLSQLNEDSDYLNQLLVQVIEGKMTYKEADSDRQRDALVQYIGKKAKFQTDGNIRPLKPETGDKILICSDGVYNTLKDEELKKALSQPAVKAAQDIYDRNKERDKKCQDNFTALVLEFV